MKDQGKIKFHNSRGHKAFSVPQIPEGKNDFPSKQIHHNPSGACADAKA